MVTVFFTESSNNIGGQELQLLQQASALQTQGHRVLVLCRPASRIKQEAEQAGLNVVPLRYRNALHLPSLFQTIRLLRRFKPRALFCHSGHDSNVSALAAYLASFLGLHKPRPKLIRVRTYQPGPARAYLYNRVFDQTLTPSKALRAEMLSHSDIRPEKIEVLYPGFDFDRIAADSQLPLKPTLVEHLKISSRRKIIVQAAMLRGEKGHLFMLDVVARLKSKFPDLFYVAAGEGGMLPALQEKVKSEGLDDHVYFAGMVKPVAPLLAVANVVVMPSAYEPLGMSQIEALSLGVPVVVSEVGGLPETVKHMETGQLCPAPGGPTALEAWVEAIGLYLTNSDLAQHHARLGQADVMQRFDMSKQATALLEYTG